jgi:hypothetical protein
MSSVSQFESLKPQYQTRVKMLHKKLHNDYILRSRTPSVISSKRSIRFYYVRYADDFIILTNANRKYCHTMIDLISKKFFFFCLKLKLSSEKTKITNFKNERANFLGYSIYTYFFLLQN